MKSSLAAYGQSLALLTDFYELTMAYGYWKSGIAEREAAFQLFFREIPFGGGFAVAAGLESALDYLEALRFDAGDLDYLAGLRTPDGASLFEAGFLDHLGALRLSCDVHALPEGTLAFPHEPLLRVSGPLLQAQLVETPLLTLVNFQTLVATKAARVCLAAGDAPVIEFGMRRAHGVDGSLSASRAAYLGGCAGTSNTLAGKLFGIPVRGTHAHSWVMAFDDELEAFRAFADAMPAGCTLLVDTYDTLEGIRKAVAVGRWLAERGRELAAIRLDSGRLEQLSVRARALLDEAGLSATRILASGDLDEHSVSKLRAAGAPIAIWGVGTRLATAYDQPALGGVYKLCAIRDDGGAWKPRLKVSDEPAKTTNPGLQQVRRYERDGVFAGDIIYDAERAPRSDWEAIDLADSERTLRHSASAAAEDLLVPVLRSSRRIAPSPPLAEARRRLSDQLARLPERCKRLDAPDPYPVGLERGLHERKTRLIAEAVPRESK